MADDDINQALSINGDYDVDNFPAHRYGFTETVSTCRCFSSRAISGMAPGALFQGPCALRLARKLGMRVKKAG